MEVLQMLCLPVEIEEYLESGKDHRASVEFHKNG